MPRMTTEQMRISIPGEYKERIRAIADERFPGMQLSQILGSLAIIGLRKVEEEIKLVEREEPKVESQKVAGS